MFGQKRLLTGILFLSFVLIIVLAPTHQSIVAAQGDEKVVVTWWMEDYEQQYIDMIQKEFVDSFNEAHPNIELQITWVETSNVLDNVRTALLGGEGPDIVFTNFARASELVNADLLLPLDQYATQYGWQDKLQPWAYDVGVIGDHLYNLPMGRETMYLFYNKSTFDENGWTPPTTRTELEALCDQMAAKNMACFAQTNQFWHGVNEWLVGAFYSNYAGADKVYEALTGARNWDDPLFVESVQLLADYAQKGYFSGGLENYYSLTFDDMWLDFCTGHAPMTISGTWGFQSVGTYCDPVNAEWDWAPLPTLRDGVTPVRDLATPGSIAINARTEHPDETAAVIDWLYNDTQRAARIIEGFNFGRWLVPLNYTAADFSSDVDPRLIRYIEDFASVTGEGQVGYTTWTFWPAKTDQYIIEELDGVLSGTTSAQDYAAEQQRLYAEETANGTMTIPVTSATSP